MLKKFSLIMLLSISTVLVGCATVPLASEQENQVAQQFNPPAEGLSGLYIYRNSFIGQAVKRALYLDNQPIGVLANKTFFYKQIPAGKHKITTDSEFGQNHLDVVTEAGKNTYVRQYIKMGVFTGGANVEVSSEAEAKKDIAKSKLAK